MTYSRTTKSNHIPKRSCAICRAKSEKSDLIRIVKSPDGRPVVDVMKKLPGHGVYICPDSDCIEKAKKSGSLAHSLGVIIGDDFWTELEEAAKTFGVVSVKIKIIIAKILFNFINSKNLFFKVKNDGRSDSFSFLSIQKK